MSYRNYRSSTHNDDSFDDGNESYDDDDEYDDDEYDDEQPVYGKGGAGRAEISVVKKATGHNKSNKTASTAGKTILDPAQAAARKAAADAAKTAAETGPRLTEEEKRVMARRAQEQFELESVSAMVGSEHSRVNLEVFRPANEKEFRELKDRILELIVQNDGSPHFPAFLDEFLADLRSRVTAKDSSLSRVFSENLRISSPNRSNPPSSVVVAAVSSAPSAVHAVASNPKQKQKQQPASSAAADMLADSPDSHRDLLNSRRNEQLQEEDQDDVDFM